MKQLFLILISVLSLVANSGCTKRNLINDDLFFKKLSSGSGIWTVDSIEDIRINTNGTTEVINSQNPTDVYYQFYLKSEIFGYVDGEYEYMAIVSGTPESLSWNEYWITNAKNERVTVELSKNNYYVYTVKENTKSRQVWERFTVDYNTLVSTKRVITLKKCNSCSPLHSKSFVNSGG